MEIGAATMSDEHYDVVVIGGGPGGYVAAIRAAQLGLRTACVEKRGTLGGTCLNIGCIPSKALLQSSHLYEEAAHGLAKHGIKSDGVALDLAAMLARKDQVVKQLTQGVAGLLKKNKVEHVFGHATIASAEEVTVATEGGSEPRVLRADSIVIATGSDVA